MYTKRSLTKAVLTLSLVAVFTGYVAAQPLQQQPFAGPMEGALLRASQLMGQEVRSPEGVRLGRVYDIVLTEDLDSISYIALSRGGILGIGQTLHAIPWDAVQFGFTGEPFVVNITERDLEQTRGFPAGNWPERAVTWGAGEFDRPMDRPMADRPVDRGLFAPGNARDVQNRRFSRLRGSHVRTVDRETVGTIRDMAITAETGEIAYTITSVGGIFGIGTQHAVVPQDAIMYLPDLRIARVDATRQTVEANAFTPGQLPNLASPAFAQNIHQAYGMEPDWPALGFVPPEDRPLDRPVDRPRRELREPDHYEVKPYNHMR